MSLDRAAFRSKVAAMHPTNAASVVGSAPAALGLEIRRVTAKTPQPKEQGRMGLPKSSSAAVDLSDPGRRDRM